MNRLTFLLNGEPVEIHGMPPTTTLLDWLRASGRTGTKEGCAEGDCGACTVLLLDDRQPTKPCLRAVNSCLILLPMVAGRHIWTAEGLARSGPAGPRLHPVQDAMVRANGSQCGYCTPGFVMALTEAAHRPELAGVDPTDWRMDDQLCGNLCRCTGYRPIRDALLEVAGRCPSDRIAPHLVPRTAPPIPPRPLHYQAAGQHFIAPTTVTEAVQALVKHSDARIVSGATDLGLDVTQRHRPFPVLVSLERVSELLRCTVEDCTDRAGAKEALIGAALPLTDLEAWSANHLPVLHRMLRYFGSRQIKHRATIGGNLCNASPIGDLAPVLLALGARLSIIGPAGQRMLPVDKFFLAYRKTALQPGELLCAVHIPLPSPTTRLGAYKVSRRRELDISTVSACFAVQIRDGLVDCARLAYGGMAAIPARAAGAESALLGQPWTLESIASAQRALQDDFTPIDDPRASAWYRRTVARNLLLGFFEETQTHAQLSLPARHTGTVINDGGPQ